MHISWIKSKIINTKYSFISYIGKHVFLISPDKVAFILFPMIRSSNYAADPTHFCWFCEPAILIFLAQTLVIT